MLTISTDTNGSGRAQVNTDTSRLLCESLLNLMLWPGASDPLFTVCLVSMAAGDQTGTFVAAI